MGIWLLASLLALSGRAEGSPRREEYQRLRQLNAEEREALDSLNAKVHALRVDYAAREAALEEQLKALLRARQAELSELEERRRKIVEERRSERETLLSRVDPARGERERRKTALSHDEWTELRNLDVREKEELDALKEQLRQARERYERLRRQIYENYEAKRKVLQSS